MAKPVRVFEEICSVPGSDEPLVFAADGSCRAANGTRYRAMGGVPILREEMPAVEKKPQGTVSGGVPQDRIDYMSSLPGYTLFLGAGNSAFRHPRVIEVEFHLFENTDIVADVHSLPFRSNTFDLFFAMNVFEHLAQPFDAAREVMRVLKPNGELHIHTAFLQPLHEAPAHYFNATEFGVREWFEDFDDLQCTVSENFNPLYSLAWLSDALLQTVDLHAGAQAAARLGDLSLAEVARFWRDQKGWNPEALKIFRSLPEPAQRSIAAGFDVRARKPAR